MQSPTLPRREAQAGAQGPTASVENPPVSLANRAPEIAIYVEGDLGSERFGLQTLTSKALTPGSRAGLLSITSAQASYNHDANQFEPVNVTQANYNFGKGISSFSD